MKKFVIACMFLMPFLVISSVDAAYYVGSDQCLGCHAEQFNNWQASGHPWKLRKVEKARYAKLPLPSW